MYTNLVSIIIPVYNSENYILDTVDSIIKQSHKNIELIVIDDGSTDNTAAILKDHYGESIRHVYQKNCGGSSARNSGIKLASGEYVAFCDHDDVWNPDKLKDQVKLLDSNREVGLVFCNLHTIDKNGSIIRSKTYLHDHKEKSLELLLGGCFITTLSQVVIRRECFAGVGGFIEDLKSSGDWELYIRLAKKYKFDFVDKFLVNYRSHDNNLTKNFDVQIKEFDRTLNIIWQDKSLKKKFNHIYKKVHHKIYYDLGVELFDVMRERDARELFVKSLFYNPLRFSSYLYIIKSLSGRLYFILRNLKRKYFNV